MTLWRTFRNNCGRLYRWNHGDFWQISPTSQDPSIPNLPLQAPSGGGTTEYGTATMSGVGTVVGAARRIRTSAGTLAGTGLMSAIGDVLGGVVEYGVAAFSGAGTLASSAVRIRIAAATISGAGTLAGLATRIRKGLAILTGTGTLAALGDYLYTGVLQSWGGAAWSNQPLTTNNGGFQEKPLRTWTGSTWGRVDTTGV